MKVPTFDIFSGHYGEKDAMWIEAIEGLANASKRMHVLAVAEPGPYFVFHSVSHQVLDSVNTTSAARKSKSDVA